MQNTSSILDFSAILAGLGVGTLLVLLILLSHGLFGPASEGVIPVVVRAFLIYLPAGYVTGARVGRTSKKLRPGQRLTPPVVHALITGVLLTLIHAFLLWATSAGITPNVEWFLAEALSASIFSAVAGALGGRTWVSAP